MLCFLDVAFTVRNRSCEKVIKGSVCHSVHKGACVAGGHVGQGCVCCRRE